MGLRQGQGTEAQLTWGQAQGLQDAGVRESTLGGRVTARSGQTYWWSLTSDLPWAVGRSGPDQGQWVLMPSVITSLVQAGLSHHPEAPKPAICCPTSKSQLCHLLGP